MTYGNRWDQSHSSAVDITLPARSLATRSYDAGGCVEADVCCVILNNAHKLSRRAVLAGAGVLAGIGTTVCAQSEDSEMVPASKALVAFITRSGNTRVIAETLHRKLGATLFEIRPAHPYPADYEEHVARASREHERGNAPPLAASVDDIAAYDEVFLGFPVWGQSAPAPLRSFLGSHDLSGKTVHPFVTHGGYGPGDSLEVLASLARGARITRALVLEADQERRTINQITDWLDSG